MKGTTIIVTESNRFDFTHPVNYVNWALILNVLYIGEENGYREAMQQTDRQTDIS